MNNNTIELQCSESLKELLNKYKENEYMSQRIYNHIVNYLPNTLDNEMKNHEKRVIRNNFLTNDTGLMGATIKRVIIKRPGKRIIYNICRPFIVTYGVQ